MYRLLPVFCIATVLAANTIGFGQDPQAESAVVQDVTQSADQAIAREPLEFTFLEEIQPVRRTFAPKFDSESVAGVEAVDFDSVFDVIVADMQSLVDPTTAAKVVVASLPTRPSADTPARPHVVSVVTSPTMEMIDSTIPAPSLGAQPTAATEEVISHLETGEVVALSGHQALPQTVVMEGDCVEPIIICGECKSAPSCNCQCKHKCWHAVTNWWHNTKLHRLHEHNIGQPGLFCERPFGVCNEGFAGAMIASGKADLATLHDYDFVHHADGGVELTQRGQSDLGRIAGIMADFSVPLSIESTFDPGEDAARRHAVLSAIAQLGLPISPDSIRLSADRTIGLSGVDAQAIHAIRTSETATGATRTRPYQDASGATLIPYISGKGGGKSR